MPTVSIITPTHDPKYLPELWESIKAQTYIDWEWVIVANNGAVVSVNDPRVRVIQCPFGLKSVGFLKKYGFLAAKGAYLVEVDHDDMITPDCLEEVARAFHENPDVGFVYSNNAKLSDSFTPYSAEFGWAHRPFTWQGKTYHEMLIPEDAPTFIWYMPDHVRAWRATVYRDIGGHNEALDVLDDQDLITRTYLRSKLHHIDKCLYLYRITGENTWLKRNRQIQSGTVRMFHENGYAIAGRFADTHGKMKVDLGGGIDKPDGYLSIDLRNGDITADLNEKWPLQDNSVGIIRAHDIIEHLPDKLHTMSEAWRVLCDGGWFMIQVPSTDGRGAFQDPTHTSHWNQNAFWYWTQGKFAQYIHNDTVKFQEFRLETIFPNEFCRKHNIPYTIAWLRAIKSDRRRTHAVQI